MKKFILHIAGLALFIYYGLPYFIQGISLSGGKAAIIAALLFAFINAIIKPLISIITLPLNILSFGILGIIINVLLFWFVASIVDGFNVLDLNSAFWGALALTVANWIIERIV